MQLVYIVAYDTDKWANIVESKDEVQRNNMSSSVVSKNKLRYVPSVGMDGKLVVHIESRRFVNVHKN